MIRFLSWITPAASPVMALSVAVTLVWPSTPAFAAATVDEAPQRSAEILRLDAYRALAEAQRLIDDQRAPPVERLNLYLRQTGLNRRLIRRIEWQIDDQPVAGRDLSDAEAAALADYSDAMRLLRLTLPAGRHRLHAELLLAPVAAGKSDLQRVVLDQVIDKASVTADYDLRLDTGTVSSPVLRLRHLQLDPAAPRSLLGVSLDDLKRPLLADGRYRPGDGADPALAHARNRARVGELDVALLELLALSPNQAVDAQLAPDYWLTTAAVMRQLGMLDASQTLCDKLDGLGVAKGEVATERLHLAEARFSAGDFDGAGEQLQRSRAALPEYRQADWRQANGLLQLARQRSGDASKTLQAANSEAIEAFRYMNASTEAQRATGYTRYNLAIAMIRNGDEKRGLSWLDLIGRSTPTDPELLALRDKANVALGWHFLRQKQGRTALGVLGRVRGDGLSSNVALLGMGWAQLAPNGERLPRVALGTEGPRPPDQLDDLPAPLRNSLTRLKVLEPELNGKVGPRSFERDDPPKNRMEGLRRALTVWKVMLDRDPREAAVQEAWLATAYAQDQLHDIDAARRSYEMTIATLRKVESEITENARFVSSGGVVSALNDADGDEALARLTDRLHLVPDAATLPVYSAVSEQQDFARLGTALATADADLAMLDGDDARAVRAQVATLKAAIAEHQREAASSLKAMALKHLEARKAVVQGYLRSALLLAARAEEQPLLETREGGAACGEACR